MIRACSAFAAAAAVLLLPAAAGAASQTPAPTAESALVAGQPGVRVTTLQVCDRGPFRNAAWNRSFGQLEVLRPDAMFPTASREDPPARCITERELRRLKARQSADLRVVDPRDEPSAGR